MTATGTGTGHDTISVRSRFVANHEIPKRYTADGEDVSPPLSWSNVPHGARSVAVLIEDPDAPDPAKPQRTFAHWLVYNLPPRTEGLAEGASDLPPGAREGSNDFGVVGYAARRRHADGTATFIGCLPGYPAARGRPARRGRFLQRSAATCWPRAS